MLRNNPTGAVVALLLAIIAVILPLVLVGRSGTASSGMAVAAVVLLVISAGVAVWIGVMSFGSREQPTLQLVPSTTGTNATSKDETVSVKVSARALSLRTNDHMLLRAVAFGKADSAANAQQSCRDSSGDQGGAVVSASAPKTDIHLLYWGESGATADGSTQSDVTVSVDAVKYRYVCGVVVLSTATTDKSLG